MTLEQALANQGYEPEEIKGIIASMVDGVNEGENPEDLLEDYGLEPDYVMDLLEYCI